MLCLSMHWNIITYSQNMGHKEKRIQYYKNICYTTKRLYWYNWRRSEYYFMFLLYMARMAENNYKNVPVSVIFTPKKCHCMNLKEDNCLLKEIRWTRNLEECLYHKITHCKMSMSKLLLSKMWFFWFDLMKI